MPRHENEQLHTKRQHVNLFSDLEIVHISEREKVVSFTLQSWRCVKVRVHCERDKFEHWWHLREEFYESTSTASNPQICTFQKIVWDELGSFMFGQIQNFHLFKFFTWVHKAHHFHEVHTCFICFTRPDETVWWNWLQLGATRRPHWWI